MHEILIAGAIGYVALSGLVVGVQLKRTKRRPSATEFALCCLLWPLWAVERLTGLDTIEIGGAFVVACAILTGYFVGGVLLVEPLAEVLAVERDTWPMRAVVLTWAATCVTVGLVWYRRRGARLAGGRNG